MPRGTDTKGRIFRTATRMMGRHGIDRISVRKILVEAEVNLALGHYHFRNREGLVEAVVSRPAQVLIETWETSLSQFEAEGVEQVAPEEVLEALFGPVIRMCQEDLDGANLLGQLLGNPDPFFRQLSDSLFHDVLSRFGHCLTTEFSGRFPDRELTARIELLAGFLFFSLSRSGAKVLLRDHDIAEAGERASLEEMVSFCMAGLGEATAQSP
jgi:AcrR family transcriptional regulator